MQNLKIFAGYIQVFEEISNKVFIRTRPIYTIRATKAEADAYCKSTVLYQFPPRKGYTEHTWEIMEIEGVTVPSDKVRRS